MNSLITTPQNLCNLVRHAESERNERLASGEAREQIAMGAMADTFKRGVSPENLGLNIFTVLVPSMVTSSPVANFTTEGGYREHIQAAALSHGVTMMCKAQKMERALEACAWDMFFSGFCAGMVETGQAQMGDLTESERKQALGRLADGAEKDVGGEPDDGPAPRGTSTPAPQLPPQWPRFKRLKPRECGWDTRMGSYDQRRFTFHQVIEDRATLLARANEDSGPGSWNAGAIANCSTVQQMEGGDNTAGFKEENEYIKYYVIYVPGGTVEGQEAGPNQPGAIYTIGASGMDGDLIGEQIREPYLWTGHPDGLHFFEGQYTTGHNSHFLSMLSGHEDAMEMLESVSASIMQRIRDHKVVHAHDVMATEAMDQIAAAPHGGHVAVPGLAEGSGMIQTIETDALTPAEYQSYVMMQQNASRQLGLDESFRGNATADVTASATMIANNASQTKIGYLHSRWHRFVGAGQERMGFEVAMNDQVALRMGEDGREAILREQLKPLAQQGILSQEGVESVIEDQKMRPLLFQGGDFADEEQNLDWYSMNLAVQPHSMEGTFGVAQHARESRWNQELAYMLNMMVQQPHGRWIDRIRATGRAMGRNDAEMVVDVQIAQEIAQIQLAQAAAQPVTSSSAPNVGGGDVAAQLPGGPPMEMNG